MHISDKVDVNETLIENCEDILAPEYRAVLKSMMTPYEGIL